LPETIAGDKLLAGFIDAPQIGPANMASKSTTPPIASPAIVPVSLEPCEVNKMVSIKINVSTISKTKDCKLEPDGIVAPKFKFVGNNNFKWLMRWKHQLFAKWYKAIFVFWEKGWLKKMQW